MLAGENSSELYLQSFRLLGFRSNRMFLRERAYAACNNASSQWRAISSYAFNINVDKIMDFSFSRRHVVCLPLSMVVVDGGDGGLCRCVGAFLFYQIFILAFRFHARMNQYIVCQSRRTKSFSNDISLNLVFDFKLWRHSLQENEILIFFLWLFVRF